MLSGVKELKVWNYIYISTFDIIRCIIFFIFTTQMVSIIGAILGVIPSLGTLKRPPFVWRRDIILLDKVLRDAHY